MESLFQTTSKITFSEYKKFSYTLQLKRLLITIAILVFCLLLLFTLIRDIIFIILAVLSPILVYVIISNNIKRSYFSNKTVQGTEITINFYDTYVEAISNIGVSKIEYKSLYKIIETKNNFYLMLSNLQGHIIIKNNCSPELINFLRKITPDNVGTAL